MTDIVSSDLTGILLQYGDDTPINITALQVQEGDNTPVAVWAEEYTLSITKTNPGYIKSAIVNRTASQYGHGATGELSNGATLYYGDTLTAAATAADTTTSYTEWVPAAIADPTFTNKTDTSVQVNNPNAFAVTLYYKLSTASSYTSVAIAASSNTTLSGLTAGSEYEFYFTASKSRTKTVTTYSVTKSWASLTVDSNESITFTGAASPVESTESGTLTSNTASYTMPYKITLTKNANVASISLTYTKVGASSRTTVRTAGTYYAEALSYFNWSATAATGYVLDHSSGHGWMIYECTVAPTASRKTFTITFALGGSRYGSWSTESIEAEYGDTISRSGNTVTIKKWDDASTNRGTSTFTNGSATGYDYSVSYNDITSPITADQTVTATTSRTRKTFTITFAKAGTSSGSWSSATITAQYGDTISRSGNVVTIKKWDDSSTNRGTSTFTPTTGYNVSYNSISSPITAAQTITATTSVKSFTYSTGTLPTGVASITCTRLTSPLGGAAAGTVANGGTIYYNDTIYFTATASTGYNNPTSSKTSSNPLTVTAAVTGASYITAGSRKTYTITFAKGGTSSGTWTVNGSTSTTQLIVYYGDLMTRSGNTITIKKWDATSTTRYTASFAPTSGYTVTYNNISSPITANQTITATTAASGKSWNVIWSGSQSLNYGTDPGDPSLNIGTTSFTVSTIDSSTPLRVYVTTGYGDSAYVDSSNSPRTFYESRRVGTRTGSTETSVFVPEYVSNTSVRITAKWLDQSGRLLVVPSIKATSIEAYY